MSGQVFSIGQLVEAAERDAQRQRTESTQMKTAAASPVQGVDLLDTETVNALAKVARDLAARMKQAEDSAGGMEGSSDANTGSVGEGMKDSLTPSAEHPDQFYVQPEGEPDISPAKNPMSIPTSTDAKPGEGTMTPGPSKPDEFLAPKIGSGFDPLRAVHERYQRAAALLAKQANSPASIPDQVDTETDPLAGPGKPESSSTADSTNPDGMPPSTFDGVQDISRQETHTDAVAEAAEATGLPAAAAKDSTEGVLNEVLKAASSDSTKAAAFRAWYNTLPPNSKIACMIRNKLASIGKGNPPTRPAGVKPRLGKKAEGFLGRATTLGGRTGATPDAAQRTDIRPEPGAESKKPKPGDLQMSSATEPTPAP